PAPDGLLKIAAMRPDGKLLYVGDTVDDARCAADAGARFIGVVSSADLRERLQSAGAQFLAADVRHVAEYMLAGAPA
ncbi:MAG: HAD family hydrolase, partial [Candidatus Binataceae bacterium]